MERGYGKGDSSFGIKRKSEMVALPENKIPIGCTSKKSNIELMVQLKDSKLDYSKKIYLKGRNR